MASWSLRKRIVVWSAAGVAGALLGVPLAKCWSSIENSPRTLHGRALRIDSRGHYEVIITPDWTSAYMADGLQIVATDVLEAKITLQVLETDFNLDDVDIESILDIFGEQYGIQRDSYRLVDVEGVSRAVFTRKETRHSGGRLYVVRGLIFDRQFLITVRAAYPWNTFLERRVAAELWSTIRSIRRTVP